MMTTPNPRPLDGRRVLVTGASSGIGAALCTALVAAGARVGMLARRRDRLNELADRLGTAALATAADVTDLKGLRSAIDNVAERLDGLDAVVANAGSSLLGSMAEGDAADWHHLVRVNLLGAFDTVRFALPHIGDNGSRDVILVGSTAAHTPNPLLTAYAAAKRGLAAYADGLRLELAPRWVRVTLVELGATRTEILDDARTPGVTDEEVRSTAPGRFRAMQPDDVAEVIVFALSRPQTVAMNRILLRPNGQLS